MGPITASVSGSTSAPLVACGNSGDCGGGGGDDGYVKWYTHYRTGKLMKASDYGYKAWPFGRKK